jgi:hypothetical protein
MNAPKRLTERWILLVEIFHTFEQISAESFNKLLQKALTCAVAVGPGRQLLNYVHEDCNKHHRLSLRSAKDVHALLPPPAPHLISVAISLAPASPIARWRCLHSAAVVPPLLLLLLLLLPPSRSAAENLLMHEALWTIHEALWTMLQVLD